MAEHVNFKLLKRSRVAPERGDIFVVQLPNEDYLFGRVILADMPSGRAPMEGANLIYIYEKRSTAPSVQHSELRPGRLLIPSLWTNRLGWTRGYFLTLENRPLEKFDLVRRHCFSRSRLRPGAAPVFVDEGGRELKQRSEPCGLWGLVSYRWIDDHVSDAVGIPRVPED